MKKKQRAQVVELLDVRIPAAFWSKVSPEPNSGCWLWAAATNTHGYGQFRIDKRQWPAHRYIYSILNGEPPSAMHIDHACRVTCCVNPAHLEAVTIRENARRGIKGVLTTHCPAGHEYTEANTRTHAGRRHCKACASARGSARWSIEKEERRQRREQRKAAARVEEGSYP